MPRLRHSANPRPRVRLHSGTTTTEDTMSATTTIDGVRIPDPQMADLLLAARAQGFRLEAGTGGGHAAHTGVTIYPPNKTHPPIRVGCTEVNPRHVGNVRRTLLRAGLQDPTTTEKEPTMPTPRKRKTSRPETPPPGTSHLDALMADVKPEERVELAMAITAQVTSAAGLPQDAAVLASFLIAALDHWSQERDHRHVDSADLDAAREEAREALRMAEEAEGRASAAEKARERAEQRGAETGELLTAALARADEAEQERDRLRAAINPLRALLGEAL